MRKGIRIAAAAIPAVAVVLVGTQTIGSASSPASTPEQTALTYLQFNMCGNASHCPDTGGVSDAIVRSVTGHDPQPYVVTLNEACASQLDYLVDQLAPHGYTGVHDPTGPTCDDGSAYGNAMLVQSGFTEVGSWELPNPGGNEPRKLLCVAPETQDIVACVTHISHIEEDQAEQIQAVGDQLGTLVDAGERVMIGGDFNVTPEDARMSPMYGSCYPDGAGLFNEADSDPACSRTGEGSFGDSKIDYVFFSEQFTELSGDVTHSDYSDHAPLWAQATH